MYTQVNTHGGRTHTRTVSDTLGGLPFLAGERYTDDTAHTLPVKRQACTHTVNLESNLDFFLCPFLSSHSSHPPRFLPHLPHPAVLSPCPSHPSTPPCFFPFSSPGFYHPSLALFSHPSSVLRVPLQDTASAIPSLPPSSDRHFAVGEERKQQHTPLQSTAVCLCHVCARACVYIKRERLCFGRHT